MTTESIKKWIRSHPRLDLLQYMLRSILPSERKCKEFLNYHNSPLVVKYMHYGEKNSGKTIYHIYMNNNIMGYCSLLRVTLLHIAYAEKLGFIPVVEWGKELLYSEQKMFLNTENSFCYFFVPVSEILLSDIRQSDLVVHSKTQDIQYIVQNKNYRVQEKELATIAEMIKKYLHFNEFGVEKVVIPVKNMLRQGKILGVHVRGTDFNQQFSRHPIMVTVDEYIDAASKLFKEGKYDYIFLATDEENSLIAFKNYFGNKLIYYSDTLRSDNGEPLHYGHVQNREHNNFCLGLEILKDVYTLGNCHGLLAGLSNVSTMARAFKMATDIYYQDQVILDKGLNNNLKESRFFIKK